MPQDPEVNLKFNAESDEAQAQLQALVAKFDTIAAAVTRAGERLQTFEEDARELAGNADRLENISAATGNAEAIKEANEIFSAGLAAVAGYGEKLTESASALMDFGANAAKVLPAFQSGNLTFEQAAAKLDKYAAAAARNEKAVAAFGAAVKRGLSELTDAEALDDTLTKWNQLSRNMSAALGEVQDQRSAAQELMADLAAQRRAMDENAAGYEAQMARIMQAEGALKNYGEQLRQVEALMHQQQRRAGDMWGTQQKPAGLGNVQEAIAKEEAALDKYMAKVAAIGEKVELSAQKRAAAVEKAAGVEQRAAEQAAAAAQKETQQQQAAAYAMQLASMSKTKLAAETRKLIVERKKAAAVGDVAAYQRLTTQLGQCRTAMRALVQQQQLNKIALLQQAQTASMVAGQLSSLGSQVSDLGRSMENGTVNITGMAGSVISLATAFKGLSGPIGWTMLALEGLQMLWNRHARRAQEAKKAMEELGKASTKAYKQMQQTAQQAAEGNLRAWRDNAAAQVELVRKAAEQKQQILREETDRQEQENRRRVENTQRSVDVMLAKERERYAAGEITQGELKDMEAFGERRIQMAKENARHEAAAREEALLRGARDTSLELANLAIEDRAALVAKFGEAAASITTEDSEGVQALLREMENLQQQLANKEEEYKAVEAEVEAVKQAYYKDQASWADLEVAKSKLQEIYDERTHIEDAVNEKSLQIENQYGVILKLTQDIAKDEKLNAYQRIAIGAKRMQEAALINERRNVTQRELEESQKALEAHKKQTEEANKAAEDEKRIKESNKRAAEEAKKRADALEEIMRTGTPEEQRAALEEMRDLQEEGSEEWKRYTEQLRRLDASQLQEEWAETQRKSLDEQEKWLAETARRFKEGSAEAKRWAKELRQVRAKKIADQLSELEKTYKVTGKYAEQDTRTQAEIHAADKASLQARRAALERMKAAPDVDAATLKAINRKIKDTEAETRRLHKSMKQAANEAQKSVENLKPLGQKAKAPDLQSPLTRAEKAYTELAKKAERQASKGDAKGLERTLAAMQRMAQAQERLTGYTGRAAALHKDIVGKLRSILRDTDAQERGLTSRQKDENKVRESLGMEKKWRGKAAKAAEQSANAAQEEAKAAEQTAQKARQAARQINPAQQTQQTQQTAQEVNTLRTQAQQMEAAQQRLTSNIAELAAPLGKLAAAAERSAELAGQLATTTTTALERLEKKLASLEKQIDRISRKIK